jgi:hypothetical protein
VNIAIQYVELSPKRVLNITLKQIRKHAQALDASAKEQLIYDSLRLFFLLKGDPFTLQQV